MRASTERGYTFIELLVVLVMIGVLAGLAVSNFRELRARANNAVALSDYRNLKSAMMAISRDAEQEAFYFAFDITGPGEMPGALSQVVLSPSVRANYVYRFTLSEPLTFFDYTLFEVEHLDGSKRYRYWDINGFLQEDVFVN